MKIGHWILAHKFIHKLIWFFAALLALFAGSTKVSQEVSLISAQAAESQLTGTVLYLPVLQQNHAATVYLRTNIGNIWTFLDTCPQNDPAVSTIRADFVLRKNGNVVGNIACSEPYSEMAVGEMSDALVYLQALRTIYYMDPGIPYHLPWTSQSLYAWMKANIGGINIVDGVPGGYCCTPIDGKLYMVAGSGNAATLEWRKQWSGIASLIDFITHEVRHADGGHGHVTGCPAFPDGTVYGCDAGYDLSNLGSYGVQYWLHEAWMTGFLHIGIGCASEGVALNTVQSHLDTLNFVFRDRFVLQPPVAVLPEAPYGGYCYQP